MPFRELLFVHFKIQWYCPAGCVSFVFYLAIYYSIMRTEGAASYVYLNTSTLFEWGGGGGWHFTHIFINLFNRAHEGVSECRVSTQNFACRPVSSWVRCPVCRCGPTLILVWMSVSAGKFGQCRSVMGPFNTIRVFFTSKIKEKGSKSW